MTRRFRLSLFVALAGAVGLHLRPCVTCLVGSVFGFDQGADSEVAVQDASTRSAMRPALTSMATGPVLHGERTASLNGLPRRAAR